MENPSTATYVPPTHKVQVLATAWQATQQVLDRQRHRGAFVGAPRMGPTILAVALNEILRSKTAPAAAPPPPPPPQPTPPPQPQPMMAPPPMVYDANGHPVPAPYGYPMQYMPQPQYIPQPPPQPAQPQGWGGKAKGAGGGKANVRVQFMVVRVLDAGWGFGAEDPAAKKPVRSPLAVSVGNQRHLCMHSYKLFEPEGVDGPKFKGARTHEYALLSPGMVFSVAVWEDNKIASAFATQEGDIRPFDLLAIELMSKSNTPSRSDYAKDARINIRTVRPLATLSAASASWLPSRIFANGVPDAAALLSHFIAGTHLTPAALALRAPHGEPYVTDDDAGVAPLPENAIPREHVLQQSWISKQLASSLYTLRVTPTSGRFAVGADDILRFHGDAALLDATGLQVPTFPVRYDEKLHPADLEWTTQLFNIALFLGAVELLLAVDTYSGGSSGEGGSVAAYARIRQSPWNDVLFAKAPLPQLPPFVAAFAGPQALRHLVVYELQPTLHLAVDTRASVNPAKGATPSLFGSLLPIHNDSWERGHGVYVFVDGAAIFQFIAPIAVPGAAAGSSASTRGFETLTSLPPLVFEEEEEEEVKPAAAAKRPKRAAAAAE